MVSNRLNTIRKGCSCAALALLLLSLSGCGSRDDGPPRAGVSGAVNLDGQPLKEGVIRFIPDGESTGPQATVPVQGGKFEAEGSFGPIVGTHRIEIESTDDGGYAMDDEQAIQQLRKAGIKKIEVVTVPAVYNQRSTLIETVTASGPNQFQFNLVSKNK